MAKWADYLISAVQYVETATTKHISKVKVHVDNGDTVAAPTVWTRQEVIAAIDKGYTFKTIIKDNNGNWSVGQKVEKVRIFNAYYIKTVADNTAKDNLGSLPTF